LEFNPDATTHRPPKRIGAFDTSDPRFDREIDRRYLLKAKYDAYFDCEMTVKTPAQ
jgi:hypothetical protein